MKKQRSFLFLLSSVKSNKWDSLDGNDFESDTRNITLWFTLLTETGHKDLVVFSQVVKATIPRDESSDFLTVLVEEHSHTLSNSGVGLFGFDTDLLHNNSLGHTTALEGVFKSGTEQSLVVFLIVPLLDSSLVGELTSGSDTSRFAWSHCGDIFNIINI